jgi:hypothetical protein
MTNPFEAAVELLPELERQYKYEVGDLDRGYLEQPIAADKFKTLITALSACRGLADGSEVIVPKPTEKTNDELRGLASLLKNNAGAAYANIDGLRSNLLEASQAIIALLDERGRLREALNEMVDGFDDEYNMRVTDVNFPNARALAKPKKVTNAI